GRGGALEPRASGARVAARERDEPGEMQRLRVARMFFQDTRAEPLGLGELAPVVAVGSRREPRCDLVERAPSRQRAPPR
ncbi:MAG: hypothetical protein K6T74_08110, partial [Geminicoccaceae bacterium]|nr:hypothetical protein [Geminicoccaceae bacterium]